MSFNAAALQLMLDKGLTLADVVEIAAANERRSDTTNAERQARHREKKRNALHNGVTPPNDNISNPPPVSGETGLAAQPKSSRGTRLAEDFELPEDWIAWAIAKRGWGRAETIEEGETFARYWQAKPGRDACKLDWPKTWQNWVVNSRRQTGPPAAKAKDLADIVLEEVGRRH